MYYGFLWIELIILFSGNYLTHPCWSELILKGMYLVYASVCTCSGLSFLSCEGNETWCGSHPGCLSQVPNKLGSDSASIYPKPNKSAYLHPRICIVL